MAAPPFSEAFLVSDVCPGRAFQTPTLSGPEPRSGVCSKPEVGWTGRRCSDWCDRACFGKEPGCVCCASFAMRFCQGAFRSALPVSNFPFALYHSVLSLILTIILDYTTKFVQSDCTATKHSLSRSCWNRKAQELFLEAGSSQLQSRVSCNSAYRCGRGNRQRLEGKARQSHPTRL